MTGLSVIIGSCDRDRDELLDRPRQNDVVTDTVMTGMRQVGMNCFAGHDNNVDDNYAQSWAAIGCRGASYDLHCSVGTDHFFPSCKDDWTVCNTGS